MSAPLNELEQRLTDTFREVADQTSTTHDGVERLHAALADRAQPDGRSHPGSRRLAAAVAVLVMGIAGGVWALGVAGRSNQTTSADGAAPLTVRVANLVPATGPLYLLPPEGTDLSGGVSYFDEPPVDVGSALVVGRLTDTGFVDVVLVAHLTSGPSSGPYSGSTVEIAGRELYQTSDGNGANGIWVAAEELADGTWIEYNTAAGADRLAEAVAATTVVDGQLEWVAAPGGLEELGRMADLRGSHPVWLSSPSMTEPASSGFLIQTSTYDPDLGLAFAGLYGPAEQTTVDGRPGFLVRPRSDLGLPSLVLTWATATGHVVVLVADMSAEELRTFASGLRSVDRQSWEAELSPFGS